MKLACKREPNWQNGGSVCFASQIIMDNNGNLNKKIYVLFWVGYGQWTEVLRRMLI